MIHTENGRFYLAGQTYSYIFKLTAGKLRHIYFGPRIPDCDPGVLETYFDRGFSPNPPIANGDRSFSYDTLPLEYGEFQRGDFRTPALVAEAELDLSTDFFYVSHTVSDEHPDAGELPALRGGQTLTVVLQDRSGATLTLYYTAYPQALVRRAAFTAGVPVRVRKLCSLSLDLPGTFEVTGLFGRHCGERSPDTRPLTGGTFKVSSSRGASSHQANPFLALSRHADEENGLVYGFNLVYSGSFCMEAAVDQYGGTRVTAGYDPDTFTQILQPGETLTAPECVLAVSDRGLGGLSRALHDLYRGYLIPEKYVRAPRPIVLNNWESTYFDFDEKRLCAIIESARGLGIDMFVLDDGWFGARDGDASGLGDWHVNPKKLPAGLKPVIDKAHACGIRFGLWFEPEMVNEDSALYRAHPDWCLRTAREPVRGRGQLVLDFSKEETVDAIFEQMQAVLAAYPIDYIKWDMNRHITDTPDLARQHKHMLGVYRLARRLTERFPDLLMEGCSGGGGRFDLGMLAFFPQIWTSDNTDAAARTRIQYGTSLAYPLSASSNHVSICPNHQTFRTAPFASRSAVAALGAFGYELDPSKLTEEERAQIRAQTDTYRKYQTLILEGDLYRLQNPFTSNAFCFEVIAKDRRLARITYMRILAEANAPLERVYPRALDDADYCIEELGVTLPGAAIMRCGIPIAPIPDFTTRTFTLVRK